MVCEVKVIHGICDGSFNVAGSTVGAVRLSLIDAFNISTDAIAFVDGNQVEMSYRLQGGSCLEFCRQAGIKGRLGMFTEAEIRRDYVGFPKEILDSLFRSLPHDSLDGERKWFEPYVDAWLRVKIPPKEFDDGSDKVMPPSSARLSGETVTNLSPLQYRLIEVLLKKRTAAKPGVHVHDVIEYVWEGDLRGGGGPLKSLMRRLNKKLKGVVTVGREGRDYIVISQ